MTFSEDLAQRLPPEAETLFCKMVDLHLRAGGGDRRFLATATWSSSLLIFSARNIKETFEGDPIALDDLADYGLLRRSVGSSGGSQYSVTADGLHFHRWLMEQRGQPVAQVERTATAFVSTDQFVQRHPQVAQQLREAFALVWADRTDDTAVAEAGGHLRSVLQDLTTDLVGSEAGDLESIGPRLRRWLANRALGDRERVVIERLVELVEAVASLDQRVTHVRDETGEGRPLRAWDELRRAAFLTAVVCFELDRSA
jgi:hypothetical protein